MFFQQDAYFIDCYNIYKRIYSKYYLYRCLHKPLFGGVTHSEVLKENKICKIELNTPEVLELPSDVVSLLQKLLNKDPSTRISAKEALK